jgi:hypothetical protein
VNAVAVGTTTATRSAPKSPVVINLGRATDYFSSGGFPGTMSELLNSNQ